ncbi:hypothetical protein [Paenimyroides marinum]|nr:hypothetical protein [Paenimyroides aquimaris]
MSTPDALIGNVTPGRLPDAPFKVALYISTLLYEGLLPVPIAKGTLRSG